MTALYGNQKGASSGANKRRMAQEAYDDTRTRVSGGTARCPCPQCEGERGKRDNKLSLTMNLATSGFYCHRCGLAGYLDREAAELAQQARAVLTGPVERVSERALSDQIKAVRNGLRRGACQFLSQWADEGASALNKLADPSDPGGAHECAGNIRALEAVRNAPLMVRDDVMFFADGTVLTAVIFLVLSGDEPSVNDGNGSYGPRHLGQLSGRLKGWVMRVLDERAFDGPKYRNAPGMLRAECFFNEKAVYTMTAKPLVVVEGCFDACSRGQDGVAVLGKLSHWQKERLIAAPRPVLIVPDGDAWEAGRMDAMELAHHGQTAGFLKLPAGKDPDEYDQPTWDAMVEARAEWF